MKLLITGASGFVGQHVVTQALKRGHYVKAVVRKSTTVERFSWHTQPQVELVRLDLRQQPQLKVALADVDAVIHLAATKAGGFYDQFAGTVLATESLLAAMGASGVRRLVAISTFSVYEYQRKRQNSLLDEESPLAAEPLERDEYSQTKLIQERLYREFADEQGGQVTIVRPGMIYGRECLWHALLGAEIGPIFLRIGSHGTLPLSYVENCAEAIILAAERDRAIGQTLNVVDDNLPTQGCYTRELQKRTTSPQLKYMPWLVMRTLAGLAWGFNRTFLGGQAKMPGILVPAKLHARFKPLRYCNRRAKDILDWQPRFSLEEALDRSCSQEDLLQV